MAYVGILHGPNATGLAQPRGSRPLNALESHLHPKFQLPRRPEVVYARSLPDPQNIARIARRRPIRGPRAARRRLSSAREIVGKLPRKWREVSEVDYIEESRSRLNGQPLAELERPRDGRIQRLEALVIELPHRR